MAKLLSGGLLASAMTVSGLAQAEWTTFPFQDPNWDPEFTVALTTGSFDPTDSAYDTETANGLQVSLNCPWFGPPRGSLRQQFNYNVVDATGGSVRTLELNPHWFTTAGDLRWGFGPGLGYMWVDPDVGSDESVWTAQLNLSVEYRSGALFLGAGTRYQLTEEKDLFGAGKTSLDNVLTTIRIGMNF